MTKRTIITLAILMFTITSSFAINFRSSRSEALFLTDKMAYELNLTDDQYNAAYEINLDYIMNIEVEGDVNGTAWEHRNTEMSYVLTAAQYSTFITLQYFYRPLNWINNRFVFIIHQRYPQELYYHRAPAVYFTYKGANEHYNNSKYTTSIYFKCWKVC